MLRYLPILLLAGTTLTAQVVSNWTGAGDGFTFTDSANWDNGVPDFLDTANIGPSADGFTIDISESGVDVSNLNLFGAVETGPFLQGDNSVFIGNYMSSNGGGILSDTGNQLVDISTDATFNLSGSLDFQFKGRTVSNDGEIAILGTNALVLEDTTLDNQGTISFQNQGSGFNAGSGFLSNNGGVLIHEGSAGEIAIGWDVQNEGTIVADQGSFRFTGNVQQDSGDLIVDNNQQIAFALNAQINGGGILGNGAILNDTAGVMDVFSSVIDPLGNPVDVIENAAAPTPGKLSFENSFSFDQNTNFFIDIYGPNPGEYDEIVFVSGLADITDNPSLSLFGDSMIPLMFNGSEVLTIFSGSYLGEFAFLPDGSLITVFDIDTFSPLGDFQLDYGIGTIQLTNFTPVPEPRTWALIGLGALMIGYWARRRLRRA